MEVVANAIDIRVRPHGDLEQNDPTANRLFFFVGFKYGLMATRNPKMQPVYRLILEPQGVYIYIYMSVFIYYMYVYIKHKNNTWCNLQVE